MIKLTKTPTARVAPLVFCDYCQEWIKDGHDTNVYWREYKFDHSPGGPVTLVTNTGEHVPLEHPDSLVDGGQFYTLHKKCTRVFEARQGGEKYRWLWMQWTDLLTFLTQNTDLTFEDLEECAQLNEELRGL